jgi:solute carrier family 25 phosphate transporter 23/24/25/41
MTIWEQLKKLVAKTYGKSTTQNPLISAACGATSGAIASTSIYQLKTLLIHLLVIFPMDVIRRHIQLNRNEYSGYSDAVKKIFIKDGIKGFYRGLLPHFLTVIPAASISLASYDLAKIVLKIN